jgi:glycosyltransferase involved in cell wall biosynthesis
LQSKLKSVVPVSEVALPQAQREGSLVRPLRTPTPAKRPTIEPAARLGEFPLLVSLVVPVFNEEDGLQAFVDTIDDVLGHAPFDVEIVFVNDGSRDRTLERALALAALRPDVRVVNLARNFGKEAALTAGIEHASGNVLVPMDVDLQDPPELVLEFVAQWRRGYDVVYGVRTRRASDTASKRITAGWFYRLFNRLSPTPIPENTGDFRLIDRRVADVLERLPERNRFMKGLFAWVGFPSIGVPYERPVRRIGSTKFNYWRLWNFALDGVTSFSTVPLRIWSYVGAVFAILAFCYASFIVLRTLVFGVELPGYASLMAVVLFLGGVQLLSLGVLGEYLGRMFNEVKQRPIYVVEGTYGRSDHAAADRDG